MVKQALYRTVKDIKRAGEAIAEWWRYEWMGLVVFLWVCEMFLLALFGVPIICVEWAYNGFTGWKSVGLAIFIVVALLGMQIIIALFIKHYLEVLEERRKTGGNKVD